MNDQPEVSVVISFLNAQRFLEEAIESVFSQTFKSWELLLVDDGSRDSGTSIASRYCQQHPNLVKYLEHYNHHNRGLPASRNLGIRNAKGHYIALLDSDDVWLPDKLEQQVAILDAHPEAAMVSGATQYWRSWPGNSTYQQRDYLQGPGIPANITYEPPALLKLHLSGEAFPPCPSDMIFRRDRVVNLGGFEESFIGVFSAYEDQAFLAKVYLSLPVFVSDACWDRYRLHGNSLWARVKETGQDQAARKFYLDWSIQYLTSQGIFEGEIKQLVYRDLWRTSHPALYRASRLGPGLLRRAKLIGDKLLPG
jgi:glycosyltransferase involved in cell wall biosynthesis